MSNLDRSHHPFSPSKLAYLEPCPLWLGTTSTTEAAEAGTYQHGAMEDEDITNLDDPKLTDEQAEAVQKCKEYRDQLIAKYPGGKILKEVEVRIDDEKILLPYESREWTGTTSGYLDFAVISADGTEAELCDWKFGFWSVLPAEVNPQGIAYLLGLVKRYPSLKKVTVHFVMPHRDEIDLHTFTSDQFPELYLRIKTIVQRALKARRDLVDYAPPIYNCQVVTSTCLFCGRLGSCPIAAKYALKIAKKFAPAQIPDNVVPTLVDPVNATQMKEAATLMDAWAKAVSRQLADYCVENKDYVPEGYVFQERVDTKVKDWRKVKAGAIAAGVPVEKIETDCLTIKMEPTLQAISDINPRGEKKTAMKSFKDALLQDGGLEKETPIYFLRRLKT